MQGRKSEASHCEPSSGLLLSPLPDRVHGWESEARHCEPSSGLLLSPLPECVQGRESDACWYLCCLPSIVCASCQIIFVSIIIMFLGHKSKLLIQASIIIISNN